MGERLEATAALGGLALDLATTPPEAVEAHWERFGPALLNAADAACWHYVALLCHASLIEGDPLPDDAYIQRLVQGHRINDALYLKLHHDPNLPRRPLRLPARLWNVPGTDGWMDAEAPRVLLREIVECAPEAGRANWIEKQLRRRFGAMNNRLKDAAAMQMMRHASALNGMQWRRLTKESQHEAVHVRLHLASGFLTTTIRVGGRIGRVTHVVPWKMARELDDDERQSIDSHFAVRGIGRHVFDLLCTLEDEHAPEVAAHERLRYFHDLLFEPLFAKPGIAAAIAALGERPTLVIVTHGALAQIPMAALHDGERYLAERFNVVQSPPLYPAEAFAPGDVDWEALLGGEPIPPASGARALFDAGLPFAPAEAANLARFYGTQAGDGCWTPEAIRALTRGRGVAFLSAHVRPSGDGTAATAIQTPDGDYIPFGDVVTEPMAADLLVLAGCVSVGQSDWLADGENSVVSLYRRAGVQAVIASLWPVDDHAASLYTGALVEALAAGKSRAAAHGDAQRAVMGTRLTVTEAYRAQRRLISQPGGGTPVAPALSFAPPRFWGAFTLSGAWR